MDMFPQALSKHKSHYMCIKFNLEKLLNNSMVFLHCQGHNKPITAMVLSEGTIYSAGGALDSQISILSVCLPMMLQGPIGFQWISYLHMHMTIVNCWEIIIPDSWLDYWDAGTGENDRFTGTGHKNQIQDMVIANGELITVSMDDTLKFSNVGTKQFG